MGSKSNKPKPGFHSPFFAVASTLKKQLAEKPSVKPTSENKSAPASARKEVDEFASAMAGVAPLASDPEGRRGAPALERPPFPSRQRDEAEAYAELADLVDGIGEFDISSTEEFIEGLGPGVDRRLLRKLKKAEYTLQSHVDLHGLSSEDARQAVARFLAQARASGQRCVLIVHGRGLHSKDGVAVLKERLRVWLTRGAIAKNVLAFCTARPSDGGAGALYVLLRK